MDVSVKAQIINLLVDLQDELGLALLFISHDLATVEHLTHRVAVMYLGKIVELADRRSLFAESHHPYTKALLSAVPVTDPTARRQRIILKGDVPSPINPPSGCRFHTRCPFVFDRCRSEEPVLRPVSDGHLSACHLDEVPGGQVLPAARHKDAGTQHSGEGPSLDPANSRRALQRWHMGWRSEAGGAFAVLCRPPNQGPRPIQGPRADPRRGARSPWPCRRPPRRKQNDPATRGDNPGGNIVSHQRADPSASEAADSVRRCRCGGGVSLGPSDFRSQQCDRFGSLTRRGRMRCSHSTMRSRRILSLIRSPPDPSAVPGPPEYLADGQCDIGAQLHPWVTPLLRRRHRRTSVVSRQSSGRRRSGRRFIGCAG